MEKESIYLPPEEKFTQKINDRINLWFSLINDSGVNQNTKEEIKKILSKFQEGALTKWASLGDAFYGTTSSMLTVIERDTNKKQAQSLFENIRDDIWALEKEIKN